MIYQLHIIISDMLIARVFDYAPDTCECMGENPARPLPRLSKQAIDQQFRSGGIKHA
jgi:hypothetical protein